MQPRKFLWAGLLTLVIVSVFISAWEWHVRSEGANISYDDDAALWADKRARVYQPRDKATVFIGSSRIKFDLNIDDWRKLTGEDAVQLAMVGTNPLPVLDDLAADPKFKGKLIVDVTEGLFFSRNMNNLGGPLDKIKAYKKRTPSQHASFFIDHFLESKFAFLDVDSYSLAAFADRWGIKNRPGVFTRPNFPMEFDRTSFDRQSIMTDHFVADTNLHNEVTAIWQYFRSLNKDAPVSGAVLDSFFTVIKKDVDQIRARGGEVLFVRTPSSGPYWMGEQMGYPRAAYWDKLLAVTQCQGIHFMDYPAINHFTCPEWSHLQPSDGKIYTANLVAILREKGWKFNQQ